MLPVDVAEALLLVGEREQESGYLVKGYLVGPWWRCCYFLLLILPPLHLTVIVFLLLVSAGLLNAEVSYDALVVRVGQPKTKKE